MEGKDACPICAPRAPCPGAVGCPGGADPGRDRAVRGPGQLGGRIEPGRFFRAQLVDQADRVGLLIWNGLDRVPPATETPTLESRGIDPGAVAGREGLQVFEASDGTTRQIVIEFADEAAEVRSVTQLRSLGGPFTVTGF